MDYRHYNTEELLVSTNVCEESAAFMMERGARFVLCDYDKRPIWKGWHKKHPTLDQVVNHWGPVGVVPYTIGMTVLDADRIPTGTGFRMMLDRLAHVVVVRSRKSNRAHIYMRDDVPLCNGRFECFGIKGDIRSTSGYVILWGDAMKLVAGRMAKDEESPAGILRIRQMEEWLITSGGGRRNPPRDRRKIDEELSETRARSIRRNRGCSAVAVSMAAIGERNTTLFDTLRLWAYKCRRGDDWIEWRAMVRARAHWLNASIPQPLEDNEVQKTADSVAQFCWNELDEIVPARKDLTPDIQARRGRQSGDARRAKTSGIRHERQPWIRLGISKTLYYNRLKQYRADHPVDRPEPTDEVFARKTPEERQLQCREAAAISGQRRSMVAAIRDSREGGHHSFKPRGPYKKRGQTTVEPAPEQAENAESRKGQRCGTNLNHQQGPANGRGDQGRGRVQQPVKAPGGKTTKMRVRKPTYAEIDRARVAAAIAEQEALHWQRTAPALPTRRHRTYARRERGRGGPEPPTA